MQGPFLPFMVQGETWLLGTPPCQDTPTTRHQMYTAHPPSLQRRSVLLPGDKNEQEQACSGSMVPSGMEKDSIKEETAPAFVPADLGMWQAEVAISLGHRLQPLA